MRLILLLEFSARFLGISDRWIAARRRLGLRSSVGARDKRAQHITHTLYTITSSEKEISNDELIFARFLSLPVEWPRARALPSIRPTRTSAYILCTAATRGSTDEYSLLKESLGALSELQLTRAAADNYYYVYTYYIPAKSEQSRARKDVSSCALGYSHSYKRSYERCTAVRHTHVYRAVKECMPIAARRASRLTLAVLKVPTCSTPL
ncbi:unnamed protein product [Trichogramma brassicae]|uniref:Uncharacterized protein n=1 Tax=Trichogramma brassicae TaxID=86971 RepID=A0A6H5ID58_9HYME|nr:unnamed protein product [Trichogramma brassicae]